MRYLDRGVVLLIVAVGLARECSAHQKWLWPNTFAAEKAPVWISFDVTWSDRPFTAESGVGDQTIEVVGPTGERTKPPHIFIGKTKTTAEMELTKPGVYRLEAVDPLTYWTRIEKDGKPQWLKKPKNEVTEAKITRSDLYWSKAIAYIAVGNATEMPPADDKEPLDIIPINYPSQSVVGERLELKVQSYGKLLPNAELKVFQSDDDGHHPSQTIRCNEAGIGTVQLDTPGRCLVSCELDEEVADDAKADIHSFNFYLTLWMQPSIK